LRCLATYIDKELDALYNNIEVLSLFSFAEIMGKSISYSDGDLILLSADLDSAKSILSALSVAYEYKLKIAIIIKNNLR
jgi:hypothetical protein